MKSPHSLPNRKPRSDSILEKIEYPSQQLQLHFWLHEQNRSYAEVRALMASEFGIATSEAALSRYYRRWIAPQAVRETIASTADAQSWRGLNSAGIEEAAIARARQLAFDTLTEQVPDIPAAQRLLATVNAMERVRLARERTALEERRLFMEEHRYARDAQVRPMSEWLALIEETRNGVRKMMEKKAEDEEPEDDEQEAGDDEELETEDEDGDEAEAASDEECGDDEEYDEADAEAEEAKAEGDEDDQAADPEGEADAEGEADEGETGDEEPDGEDDGPENDGPENENGAPPRNDVEGNPPLSST